MSRVVVQLVAMMLVGAGDPRQKSEPAPAPRQVGDVVMLRDGKSVRGIVLEWSPRTGVRLIVSRAWAKEHLPEWTERWEKSTSLEDNRARRLRKERLKAWRAQRTEPDRVGQWIDDQIKRLEGPSTPSALMLVNLNRGDVRSVKRGEAKGTDALRLAWSAQIREPEQVAFDDLISALESRGLLLDGAPVDLSALLPIRSESETEWLARRAATEIQRDQGLRFIRYGSLVMAEPIPGAAVSPDVVVGALGETVRQLLEDRPAADPLAESLKAVEKRGRIAAMVTEIDLSGNRGVKATCTLWIRMPGGWTRGMWRVSQSDAAQLAAGAGDHLMDDPQVASIFRLLDSSGLPGLDASMKQQAFLTGESARRALSNARSGLQRDLDRLDLIAAETSAPVNPRPAR